MSLNASISAPRRFVLSILWVVGVLSASAQTPDVWPGVEVLVRTDRADALRGKRVAILTNPTGVDRDLNSTIDLIRALPEVEVVRLFAPEHGLRGGYFAGEKVDETRDPVSGLPIVSLYGALRRPPPDSLAGLDAVLYDIQDIGDRTYTFVSTLTYMMEACEAAGVAVWVLDRPDPMGGRVVGGPTIEPGRFSFIGVHDVARVYGMTPGEWARMIQRERTPNLELEVVPMRGWKRGMTYGDLGWIWIPPSQHVPRWETSFFYAMTGAIGELSGVSVGIGTAAPFESIGAPWLDGASMAREMNALGLAGVRFRPTTFTPRYGVFVGLACSGVQIHLTDPRRADPTRVEMELMSALQRMSPRRGLFGPIATDGDRPTMFALAVGDRRLADALAAGDDPRTHAARIEREVKAFLARREKCLLYK